ncbi:MAG: hypothetical protein ACK5JU_12485 [Bacteroidales bacterium]
MRTFFGFAMVKRSELLRLQTVDRSFVRTMQDRNRQVELLLKEREVNNLLVMEVKERNVRLKKQMKIRKEWMQKWMVEAAVTYSILKDVKERVDEF